MGDRELQKTAKAAIDEFVAGSLVFLLPGRKNAMPSWVASGTLFSTRKGRAVVLTAKHNVDDAAREPIRLGYYKCENAVENVAAGIVGHLELDVAAVALNRDASEALSGRALDAATVVALDDEAATDPLVLAGFPSVLTQMAEQERPGQVP